MANEHPIQKDENFKDEKLEKVDKVDSEEENHSSDGEVKECIEKEYPKKFGFQDDEIIINKKQKFLNTDTNDFHVTVVFNFKDNLKEHYIDKQPTLNLNEKKRFLFDKKFKIISRKEKTYFTINDVIHYKSTKVKMTNSLLYFFNTFYKKAEFFKFNKMITSKPIKVSSNIFNFLKVRRPKYAMLFLPKKSSIAWFFFNFTSQLVQLLYEIYLFRLRFRRIFYNTSFYLEILEFQKVFNQQIRQESNNKTL